MSISTVLPILQTILAGANICIIGYAFLRFMNKPHSSLEGRITELEVKQKEVENALHQGNDRFRDQESTNEVMQSCMLALIDFELAYCINTSYEDTDDLMQAKKELRSHLSRKHHD